MPHLTDDDRALLAGASGSGAQLAMRLVVELAEAVGARSLRDVSAAHIDGCLYHGRAALDFAERLVGGGASVSVPTTLNVGSLDLLHPDLFRGGDASRRRARALMAAYQRLGCEPTWTCAPYLLESRPAMGDQVAFGESNAIAFVNSVLGARTERYGDFIDACAAITGRVPDFGLHREENRRGELVFDLAGLPDELLLSDVLFPVLGHLIGRRSASRIPVVLGLPPTTSEDQLKAFGAAAASSGSVALFHAVGLTPEAPSLEQALGGRADVERVEVTAQALRQARDELTSTPATTIEAVSLGTPHASLSELRELAELIAGERVSESVELYVSTGRQNLAPLEADGALTSLESAGVTVLVDTCTYVTPILRSRRGPVMTNSGKWAYYAPANLGVEVIFGSLRECVRSAITGRLWRDPALWTGVE